MDRQRVLITGGSGFLGRELTSRGRRAGWNLKSAPRGWADLTDYRQAVTLVSGGRPEAIVHLAAFCGGIGTNHRVPAEMLDANCRINANVFRAAAEQPECRYLIAAGSVCAYSEDAKTPFTEQQLWNGAPHDSNRAYGTSKLILEAFGEAYERQYGLEWCVLHLANLYGRGENVTDAGHVVGGIVRKIVDAQRRGDESVTLWGTGQVTRDLLHVSDAARAFELAVEHRATGVFNVGTARETAICDLAELIKANVGYGGEIIWNAERPSGQVRRCVSYSKANVAFGFQPEMALEQGIQEEVEWYLSEHAG